MYSEIIGSCWLKQSDNVHGTDLLIDGRAPRHGEIMKMPKLAQTFKVCYYILNHDYYRVIICRFNSKKTYS